MKNGSSCARPAWLNKKVRFSSCVEIKNLLRGWELETVCEQALCPNIGECFNRRQATFLILGRFCTRSCSFCNVNKNSAPLAPDPAEPERVAEAVGHLNLKHVIVTSVTRDDLSDGGAAHFAETARRIKNRFPAATIEFLLPDFRLSAESLRLAAGSAANVLGHNLETVPRLYPPTRRGADYRRSLEVLRLLKQFAPAKNTKSGIMLGLGEKEEEVLGVFDDLRAVECDFLSIGQYLAPSAKHYPVKEYVRPEKFDWYRQKALACGFVYVVSAPYARSSYMAEDYLAQR